MTAPGHIDWRKGTLHIMSDSIAPWLLIGLTATEFILLLAVLLFFKRLKRSESLLEQLQQKQEQFVAKLSFSAELEQELVASFEERQQELLRLDQRLEQRARDLEALLERSDRIPRKPESPRQIVLNGHKRGLSVRALAQAAGISIDEVELILMEARRS